MAIKTGKPTRERKTPTRQRREGTRLMSNLDLYFQEVKAFPLLTREQECELARGIRSNDEAALHKLVNSNLRFVVSIAKEYAHYGVPLEDLINEGNLGLLKAAQRFDETRGYKFISYAVWWVRQAMLQALADQSRIYRVPTNRANALYRVGKVQSELYQNLEREPTVEEIAQRLKISRQEVRGTMGIAQPPLSLTEPYGADDDNPLQEFLQDEEAESPDTETYRQTLREEVARLLASLNERERMILSHYFGLEGRNRETLEEIGQRLGLTRERIRQIKEETFDRIRNLRLVEELKTYLD